MVVLYYVEVWSLLQSDGVLNLRNTASLLPANYYESFYRYLISVSRNLYQRKTLGLKIRRAFRDQTSLHRK